MRLFWLFLVFGLLVNTRVKGQAYPGTNLRGRVVTTSYRQQVPMVSAKVELYFFNKSRPAGSQWVLIASTLTDTYGFYFFRGISPNIYTIWINQSKSYNVQVSAIDYRRYAYQDLPQFLF